MANTLASAFVSETVLWGFVPMTRASLKSLMDGAGYPKTGFGSGDFWAFGREAVATSPLSHDLAGEAFDALETSDADRAWQIVDKAAS